jgi:hypothetical protein
MSEAGLDTALVLNRRAFVTQPQVGRQTALQNSSPRPTAPAAAPDKNGQRRRRRRLGVCQGSHNVTSLRAVTPAARHAPTTKALGECPFIAAIRPRVFAATPRGNVMAKRRRDVRYGTATANHRTADLGALLTPHEAPGRPCLQRGS